MTVYFKNQNKYEYWEHLPTGNLLAIDSDDSKRVKNLFKQNKGVDKISDTEQVKGFMFIVDEEFDSLKIDFDSEVIVKIKELTKANIK